MSWCIIVVLGQPQLGLQPVLTATADVTDAGLLTCDVEKMGLCSVQALRALGAAMLSTMVQSALSTVGSGAGALRGHSCGLRSPRLCTMQAGQYVHDKVL